MLSQEDTSERELPELPDAVLLTILRKCDLRTVGHSASVDRRWHLIASDDSLWKSFCEKHLHLLTASDLHGNPCPSYKEAFKLWHANFCIYPHSLLIRAKRCWDSLREWTSRNYREIANSLQPGVSEKDLDKFEEQLGWKLPQAARLIYRFCGGQDGCLHFNEEDDPDEDMNYVGLFGGYSFYDHTVNVHFVSLEEALLLTQHFIPQWGKLEHERKWVIVAASFSLEKFFLLDCQDGSLFVGTRNLVLNGEMMRCVPPPVSGGADMEDSMLRWFEVYSSRLNCGMYTVQRFDNYDSISLYPESEPLCSEAVTSGVQIRSSAVFVPECSTVLGDDDYLFSYLIRMRLLASEEDSQASNVCNSCQLSSRHWVIRDNGAFKPEVRGPGVIGEYPLLRRGAQAYTYASCSSSTAPYGSIVGDFTFVPGSLACPKGPQFVVNVAEFPLEVPSYIY